MSGKRRSGDKPALIVIKRDDGRKAAHHGGAWKVAYADFVTAMMAFFLLMWLLNATTEEQKRGLADYFSPDASLIHAVSGTGQPFGGHTPVRRGGAWSPTGARMSVMPAHAVAPPDPDEDDSDASAEPTHPEQPAQLRPGARHRQPATRRPPDRKPAPRRPAAARR